MFLIIACSVACSILLSTSLFPFTKTEKTYPPCVPNILITTLPVLLPLVSSKYRRLGPTLHLFRSLLHAKGRKRIA
jgi:hypothetical protein